MELKLNYKRTFYIGFAFFAILMLWQVYNYYIPLILENLITSNYGEGNYKYLIGIIMAADNFLALFMLPVFGNLSDKTHTRLGKRMPYIIGGTIGAALLFPLLPVFFLKNSLWGVIAIIALVLIIMNIYRNPAVALMPDITPKPLRSKANGIINLVGYIGAIFAGALSMLWSYSPEKTPETSILYPFILTSVLMIISLILLTLKIKENKLLEETREEMEEGEKYSDTEEEIAVDRPLSKTDRKNLVLLIISVFLWFFAFNAIETFGSTYGTEYLRSDSWGSVVIVLTIASLITFVPAGILADKIGRKRVVQLGLVLIIIPCIIASFIKTFSIWLILLIAAAGIGWAMINCNSYPMVVESANKENIGKYTGYYYTASMIAQTITPVTLGFIMDFIGHNMMFPYTTLFMAAALAVFSFIKTGRHTPEKNYTSADKNASSSNELTGEDK